MDGLSWLGQTVWEREFSEPTPLSDFESIFEKGESDSMFRYFELDGEEYAISKVDGALGLAHSLEESYRS